MFTGKPLAQAATIPATPGCAAYGMISHAQVSHAQTHTPKGLPRFMPACLCVAAGPSKVWDLNDVCKRITLDAFMGWGFDSSLNVSDVPQPS